MLVAVAEIPWVSVAWGGYVTVTASGVSSAVAVGNLLEPVGADVKGQIFRARMVNKEKKQPTTNMSPRHLIQLSLRVGWVSGILEIGRAVGL